MALFATFILLLSTMLTACGLTLDLMHKSHPSMAHFWQTHSGLGKPYEANISFSNGAYVVHFEVGTPPHKSFALFDTGSSLFWLQTSGCDQCLPQPEETRYDPTRSSTFERVGCTEPACVYSHLTANTHCKIDDPDDSIDCLYDVEYGDDTNSSGYMATDMFTFMDDSMSVRLLMGVGTRNSGGKEIMGAPGIFGMSRSAWYQFQNMLQISQFSYCMPDDTNKVGYVKLGEAAIFSRPSVKYYPENKLFYSLSLTGVSFNDKPLNPSTQDSWQGFRMILDTGISVSRIHLDVLEPLQAELENFFGEEYIGVDGYNMCWPDILMDDENVKNMTITLRFNDIVEFKLSQPQIWQPVQVGAGDSISEFYCINLMEKASGDSVLGAMQTTNKNIAINWVAGEVAIEDRMC